jgi:hypothetical protein
MIVVRAPARPLTVVTRRSRHTGIAVAFFRELGGDLLEFAGVEEIEHADGVSLDRSEHV